MHVHLALATIGDARVKIDGVVDLEAAASIDDDGLGVLLGAGATARDQGGGVRVVATTETMRSRLQRTRLDRIDVRGSVAG